MATEVIKIIDPDNGSGTDYTSLTAWEAAQQGDLTGARDEIAVAKCRCTGGTADTAAAGFTIDGWTTSATQYIKIWTDPAESYRHSGTYPSGNKYRFENEGGPGNQVFGIVENYVKVIGLSFYKTSNGDDNFVWIECTGGVTISHCIFKSVPGGTAGSMLYFSTDHNAIYSQVYNNLFYDCSGYAIYCRADGTAGRAMLYNNTFYNCYVGIRGRGDGVLIKNNLAIGCTDGYLASSAFEVADYNAYDEGTDPGTNGIDLSASADADIFTDAASDDYSLCASSDADGVGANLYSGDTYFSFTDDILGNARPSSGAWCVGAYEYVAAGGKATKNTRSFPLGIAAGMNRRM